MRENENVQIKYADLEDNELLNLEFAEEEPDEVGAIQWNPEENEYIIGRYIITETGRGKGSGLLFHTIRDTNSQELSLLGCTVLNNKLKKYQPGDILKITYKGLKMNKNGNYYKDYTVVPPL